MMTAVRENRFWDEVAPSRTLPAIEAAPEKDGLRDRLAGASATARRSAVRDLVRKQLAAVLGFADAGAVEISTAFRDLGVDSLMAVELRNGLAIISGLKLASTVVFDYPSVEALADFLIGELFGSEGVASSGVLVPPVVVAGVEDPVVVVGMGCRFPGGVVSPEGLWGLVSGGVDAMGGFPVDRGWEAGGDFAPVGGFVEGVADFDAGLFGISPREALAMDPQQRLLLEVAWESLERAGIGPMSLRGRPVGVFAGTNGQDYPALLAMSGEEPDGYGSTGSSGSVLSGRVSYALGLEGPAVTVDTACSSSLVAMHLAAQSLRSGECSLALAGGVTVMSTPGAFVEFARQGGLAGDGRCKAFSDDADGTGWGEGAGVLVLERLSDARRNGHPVLAVLRGSAVNQDGASNGLTAPNGPSQQRVIRQALADAGLSASDVDAVEAHGTGTSLGDPIEAQALLATYGQGRQDGEPLWLGSVKSNIGHTQAAAGVAGVIKMVLAMQHEVLPKSLYAGTPSSHVDWSAGAVELLADEHAWPGTDRPRRAGVSAFGVSGTNAHLIIEEPPELPAGQGEPETAPVPLPVMPWLISAKTSEGVRAQAARLSVGVDGSSGPDVGFSLATMRTALEHRAVVLGSDVAELRSGLSGLAAGESSPGVVSGVAGSGLTGFVFSGQGGQRMGMGRELADAFPVFEQALDEVCGHFDSLLDRPLREVMFEDGEALGRTGWAQPALFAVEVALFRLAESWGLVPDYVLGHSVGELAAAHVAGVLSLEDACRLVAARAQLMQALPEGGAMWAVRASTEEITPLLVDGVSIAAVNAPGQVVLSGERAAVESVAAALPGRDGRWLEVSHAFHSVLMDPMLKAFGEAASGIATGRPQIPVVSTLTGEPVEEFTGQYWVDQVRGTVRFADAVTRLQALGVTRFVEVGPDASLVGATGETCGHGALTVPLLHRKRSEPATAVTALARLWADGCTVDWQAFYAPTGARRTELPTYAFQHQRYWPRSRPQVPTPDSALNRTDAPFWDLVARGDLGTFTTALDVEADAPLGDVMSALDAWQRRREHAASVDGLTYRITWTPTGPVKTTHIRGSWLIVEPDTAGDAESAEDLWPQALTDALTTRGVQVHRLRLGATDLDRDVLAARLAAFEDCGRVVSFLGQDDTDHADHPGLALGLVATTVLVQALGDTSPDSRIWAVTSGAVGTGPGDVLSHPGRAAVWGLGRVVALEEPDRWGGLVDVPARPGDGAVARLVDVLAGGAGSEDQLALRAGAVLGRRLVVAPQETSVRPPWKPAGTVLVTGGTGALGARVARWAVERGAGRVALLSRRGIEAPGAAELRDELMSRGAEVTFAVCDIADRARLADAVARIESGGHRISSVFHTAGLTQSSPLRESHVAELAEMTGAKVAGAVNLDALLEGRDLDAFVLYSSVAATWGSGGQSGYAAANAFLDALATRRHAQGLPATSIAWGPWSGGGMAALEGAEQDLRRRGLLSLVPEDAMTGLELALTGSDPCVSVADVEWSRFLPTFTVRRPSVLLGEFAARHIESAGPAEPDSDDAGSALCARLRTLDDRDRRRLLLELVRGEAASALGHTGSAAIEPDRAFRDLGFDSLTAVEFRDRLVVATGLQLAATLVFDYPTAAVLTEHLVDQVLGTERLPALQEPGRAAVDEPIALVAMGCRFPGGATDPEALWRLLAGQADAITPFPTDRGWDLDGLDTTGTPSQTGTFARTGGFLADAAEFDAALFGISPREALAMDPQQRLLLEVSWEALERAGIAPLSLKGDRVGVFVGAGSSGYLSNVHDVPDEVGGHLITGNSGSVLSGRVSYALGFEGPAVTVDTACSSSLVALHLAVQSLRSGECSLALAGGVTVIGAPDAFVDFARQGGLAADGRCKPFSDDADGTGWSEGIGLLLVERLSDARRNGHPVLAVVRGSAVNQDGASNGLTAPNGPSQQRVIRQALADAGLSASDVDVVEAHGTGTSLGDPIEAQALLATYGQERRDGEPLWLGSVKSNIGHTQAAAGAAGLIKMVLAMQHEVLPKSLHAGVPSSHVDWSAGAVELLADERAWPGTDRPRRAGVSAFGVSGTNAHVIIEEAPAAEAGPEAAAATAHGPEAAPVTLPVVPWIVSARSPEGVAAQADRLASGPADPAAGVRPEDVGLSLATTRTALEHRAVVLGSGSGSGSSSDAGSGSGSNGDSHADELRAQLRALAAGEPSPGVVSGVVSAGLTGFVFSGQGGQRLGMGEELAQAYPVFGHALDEVCGHFDALLDRSLREVMYEDGDALRRTGWAQPALFAVEVALFRLMESWGVCPDHLVGHSVGELAAAHIAGVMSLEDACRLVAARASLMQALPTGGAMWAVRATVDEVAPLLVDGASIAAVNAPGQVVVSGTRTAVETVAAALPGREGRWLDVSHAFHSALMDPMLKDFGIAAASVTYARPRIPIVSTLTGEPVEEFTARYWVDQVRGTVAFGDAVTRLKSLGVTRFVELGPDASLVGAIGETCDDAVRATSLLRRDRSEPVTAVTALARLWADGCPVDWSLFYAPAGARVTDLPTYAFQRRRYWLEGASGPLHVGAIGADPLQHPLLGAVVELADGGGHVFTGRISTRSHPWLAGHQVAGDTVFPGTAYVELAVRAGDQLACDRVDELILEAPLVLSAERAVQLQIVVDPADENGNRYFGISSRGEGEPAWIRHASGVLAAAAGAAHDALTVWPPAGATPADIDGYYPARAAAGYGYGEIFQGLTSVWRKGAGLFAEVALGDEFRSEADRFGLHPAALDAALQALSFDEAAAGAARLPFCWNGVTLHATGAAVLRVALAPGEAVGSYSVTVADTSGELVLTADSLILRPSAGDALTPDTAATPPSEAARTENESATPLAEAVLTPEGGATPAASPARPARVRRKAAAAVSGGGNALRRQLAAQSADEQHSMLLEMIGRRAAMVLDQPRTQAMNEDLAFRDLGFTSLTAVELRQALEEETGLRLAATLVFDYPTPRALIAHLRAELLGESPASAAPTARLAGALDEPIAIIGMSCRYPGGVRSADELWQLVAEGTDAISGFPTDRGWDLDALYDPDPDNPGTCYVHEGGFLHDAGQFDATFFGISPREAVAMDPQQRLLLEISWEAMEQAGLDAHTMRGSRTGVFAGVTYQDYGGLLAVAKDNFEGFLGTGNSPSVLSGRVSYTFGLEGPALTIDTACSSSLVALHSACQALREGDCSMALAGGVTVMSTPISLVEFSRQRALAMDGRSKPFSSDADGASWAEGAGMLLLERLSDARRNGHRVLAVVRGSATNQDGASNGLTAPNGPAQQRVIRQALSNAGLSASDVDVVEAHGTGTSLGDPIEAQALIATYGQERPAEQPLWLGSVKSNIGHSQAAAGVAGMIKMVQAMRHGVMPRSLHVGTPSTHVDWSAGAVELLAEEREWPQEGRPRRAAVSAFGMSGTNAHVILEQAPEVSEVSKVAEAPEVPEVRLAEQEDASVSHEPSVVPWLLSGRGAAGLRGQAAALSGLVDVADPVDVGWALATTRARFEHRAVVVGGFGSGLAGLVAGEPVAGVVSGVVGPVGRTVFVFPGQGAQWSGMGRALLESSPVFAGVVARCEGVLAGLVGWSVTDVLRGVSGGGSLERVDVVQPASFVVMVALAELWRSYGVEPAAVVGHSQGEIAAAYVAGVLSLEDALRIVVARSAAIAALAGAGVGSDGVEGTMASVRVSAERVRELLGAWAGRVSVAAVNGPSQVVVSGEATAVDELVAECGRQGVRARRIAVDYASHSAAMDVLRVGLAAELSGVAPRAGRVPLLSTVTGEFVDPLMMDGAYWFRNLREPVRFADAIERLAGEGYGTFVEVSSHPVLTAAVEETLEQTGADPGAVTGSLRRDDGGPDRFLAGVGELWVRGVGVDWAAAFRGTRPKAVDLPTYAFQRQHYWPQLGAPGGAVAVADGGPVDSEFWAAVEREDSAALAGTLDTDSSVLDPLLPALARWRREQREQNTTDTWRYRVSWTPLSQAEQVPATGTWLVVTPESGAGQDWADAVGAELTGRGATVRQLTLGAAHLERGTLAGLLADTDDRGGINGTGDTGDTGDTSGTGGGDAVAGVVSLLAWEDREVTGLPGLSLGVGLTSVLLQALGDAELAAPVWALTSGAVSVAKWDGVSHPGQAAVWGLGRVAGLEHPDRWGGLVDVPGQAGARSARRVVDALTTGTDDQLAVRESGLFGRRLVRAPRQPGAEASWTPSGTVLITGGTGALGARMARWAAGQGADHVVLTSRRGAAAPGAPELRQELEALGAEVTLAACDMADREQVAALLGELAARSPLTAVVHAAGVLDDGILDALTPERIAGVMAPKAHAATVLHELTSGLALDAFVMFASTAGTWGGPGQANYAAANAVLDALAEHRRANGLAATSVAWGPWADSGMADSAAIEARQRKGGIHSLAPESAVTVLRHAVADGEATLTVAGIDWERYAPAFTAARRSPLLDGVPEARKALEAADGDSPAGTPDGLAARLAPLTEAERDRELLELVRKHVAGVLGFAAPSDVEPTHVFSAIGFDSLTAIELRNRLGLVTGLRLPATLIFDCPTPHALVRHLRHELVGEAPEVAEASATPALPAQLTDDPVAVVGMACRLPGGVGSPEEFWRLLADGTDAISDFPTDRGWDVDGVYDPDPDKAGTTYTRRGGFVSGVREFDATLFGINPREALSMDPQQRLLLETVWEAAERSGIDPLSLAGSRTGMFAGSNGSDYGGLLLSSPQGADGYFMTGNAASVLSGRVAYTLGLEGPAVTVDTACSSSLVALHLAAQALRADECSLALASGVTLISTPAPFVQFSRQHGLATDGRCKAFSDDADGTGWAEGVGVLVLERLSDARRNGHRVLALVSGSATNQDGASNGLTAPNGPSQQRVIRQALASAGLSASDVDAVEAHGTGTTLGDPIEAQALLSTYGQGRTEDRPLWLGSVKSNIGHTQAAAGVAGLIKVILAMQHEVMPRTLHVGTPSTHVDWSAGAVQLLAEAREWPRTDRPRRAGVSSFGISGTNAHVILEEPPAEDAVVTGGAAAGGATGRAAADGTAPGEPPTTTPTTTPATTASTTPAADAGAALPVIPWLVSAKTPAGVAAQADRLLNGLPTGQNPVDVALSLATTRAGLEHRAVVLGSDQETLHAGLAALAAGGSAPGVVTGTTASGLTAFVFSGQGGQRLAMGEELAQAFPVFDDALSEVCAHFDAVLDRPLREVVREDADALRQTGWAQPALFAVEVALFRLVESWGITPDVLVGHSVGELAAAHIAGVMSLEDACRLVAARAGLMQALPAGGAMWAVRATADEVAPLLVDGASIAAVNAPGQVVVSGARTAVETVAATLSDRRGRWLDVSHAFHSALMDPMLAEFGKVAQDIEMRRPRIPIVSTLTGEPVEEFDARYWADQVRGAVAFADAVTRARSLGATRFLELGPDASLIGAIGETYDGALAVPVLHRERPEPATAVTALAGLWADGCPVDWQAFHAPTGAVVTALPTYAFQRKPYWPEAMAGRPGDVSAVGLADAGHPLLGAAVALAGDNGHLFTNRLSVHDHPWLADHEVMGTVLFPGTAFLELAMRAADEVGCDQVEELTLAAPLVLPADHAVQLQLAVGGPDGTGLRQLQLHARPDGGPADTPWTLHATGTLGTAQRAAAFDLTAWPPPGAEAIDVSGFYEMYRQGGFAYGPSFQGLRQAWRVGEEVFAEIALDQEHAAEAARYGLHPPLLDAALQALTFVALDGSGRSRLPFSWSGVSLFASGASTLRVRLAKAGADSLTLSIADGTGQPVACVNSLAMRQVSAAQLHTSPTRYPDAMFCLDWADTALPGASAADTTSWAVLGPDELNLAGTLGVRHVPGPDALGEGPAPDVVLVPCISAKAGADGGADGAGTGGDETSGDDTSGDDTSGMAQEARALSNRVLSLVQQWLGDRRFASSRLALITRGAVAADPESLREGLCDPAAATVWGLIRSAQSEEPGRFVLVDIDGAEQSVRELPRVLAGDEPQVVVRDGAVRAARLARLADDGSLVPPPGTDVWRLDTTGRGTLANLALVADPELREPLAPGQVRIGVRAAGLNFRDVLNALDMYPGEPGAMGVEGAGVITEVAPDVTQFAPGDRVLGMFGKAFGPVTVADHRMIAPMPDGWTFEQAASVPIVFLTAYYALVVLARLQPGEKVLVHAAAGGVGMAAVQLARHLGAEAFGTASDSKQHALRDLGLGDDHIASSRNLDFAQQFRTVAPGGRVDVVLNSLAREYVDTSLGLLGAGGRFVEMGKTDIRTPESVTEQHAGVAYGAFDLIEAGPERIGEMLTEVLRLLAAGALRPLPVTSWDVRRAPDAFRYVSQARHIGKVVLTVPARLSPGGTVLVTGATGGLGRYVARHLVEQHGARNLLLVSRRGESADGAAELRAELTALGADVRIEACDASDRAALARTVNAVPAAHPLTAVVHVAGVVDDGMIPALDPDRMDTALRPKMDAALNLYELTKDADLAAFVLFSGAAGTLGGAGQANYAAANAFVDEFARWARGRGVPAVSLAWGPWVADRGMTGHLTDTDIARMEQAGLRALGEEQGMALLDFALTVDRAALLPMRLSTGPGAFAAGPVPPLFRALAGAAPRRTAAVASAESEGIGLVRSLRAMSAADRADHLLDLVCGQAATVLGHGTAEEIEPDQAFNDIGFDSLTAIELRNRLNTAAGIRLPATLVFDYPTPTALAEYLMGELLPDEGESAPGGGEDTVRTGSAALDEIERLEQALDRLAAGGRLDGTAQGGASGDGPDGAVSRRLQALAAKWAVVAGGTDSSVVDDDALESATADELFKMIDGEFGGAS
ncbi:type I polyketide synthase [Streptomyces sp. NPDC090053]|uniref:type I polyketide synthase n=1 Tax=Streptomyces sp. NPDC090053 TaxID=3365932 RepID=UPI0037FE24A5